MCAPFGCILAFLLLKLLFLMVGLGFGELNFLTDIFDL